MSSDRGKSRTDCLSKRRENSTDKSEANGKRMIKNYDSALQKRSASTCSDEAVHKRPKLARFTDLQTGAMNSSTAPGGVVSSYASSIRKNSEEAQCSATASTSRAVSSRFRSDGRRFVVRNSLSEQELLDQKKELQQRLQNEPDLRSKWQQASNRLASFKCRQKRKNVVEALQDQILRMREIREQRLQEIEVLRASLLQEKEEKRMLLELMQREEIQGTRKAGATAADVIPIHGQQQQVIAAQPQGQQYWVSEFLKHFLLPAINTNMASSLEINPRANTPDQNNGNPRGTQQQTSILEVLHGLVQTALPPVYPDSVVHQDEEMAPFVQEGPPIPSEILFVQSENPFGKYFHSSRRSHKKKKKAKRKSKKKAKSERPEA